MRRPLFSQPLRVCALVASPLCAALAAPAFANTATDHEVGWVCFQVDDVRVMQISAFNKDAGKLSAWVPKQRLHVEAASGGQGGRVCAPALVGIGGDELPEETLIFERNLQVGGVSKPSIAEVVITPSSPEHAEVTISLIGVERHWSQRDGVWTFEHPRLVSFPQRTLVGLSSQAPNGDPASLFHDFVEAFAFSEPCQAVTLNAEAPFHPATHNRSRVRATGGDPQVLPAGTTLTVCDSLAQNEARLAAAKGTRGKTTVEWGLLPRDASFSPSPITSHAFTSDAPLGGYQLCQEPQWQSATLTSLEGHAIYELQADQRWTQGFSKGPVLAKGTPLTLLAQRSDWALVQVTLDNETRTLAIPASAVELPTGPIQDGKTTLRNASCKHRRGQWRALKANTQTFTVREGGLGSEVGQIWRELPQGTQVLQLCQSGSREHGKGGVNLYACEPFYAAKTNAGNAERYTLVRYAGTLLALSEHSLRDRSSGEFALREERGWLYDADLAVRRSDSFDWALSAGVGTRLSFLRPDDHGWNVGARVERLSEDAFAFVGGVGLGGDSRYTYLTLEAGAAKSLYRFPDLPLELHGLATVILDLGLDRGGGGLHLLVHPRASLRWLNEVVPLRLEAGVQFGLAPLAQNDWAEEGELQFNFTLGLQAELFRF